MQFFRSLLVPLALGGLVLPMPLQLSECGQTCSADTDGDGTCDDVDICGGGDDSLDNDVDGIPDGCDVCPADAENDEDNDGVCDGSSGVTFLVPPPRDGAVLQRDGNNQHLLILQGHVHTTQYDSASLVVTRDGAPFATRQMNLQPTSDGQESFDLQISLPAGLSSYGLSLSLLQGGSSTSLLVRNDVVVGEVILIQGQSNAVAADYAGEGIANNEASPWIRSFGSASTLGAATAQDLSWATADGQGYCAHATVGIWGLRMAQNLLGSLQVPIGLINGAVGGTTVAQHQRNDANPEDLNTIYGRFLYRVNRANVADSARILLWYQGESDGNGYGPTSAATQYLAQFDALKKDWQQDFARVEHTYVFQIHNGCGVDNPRDGDVYLAFLDAAGNWVGADRYSFEASTRWRDLTLAGVAPANTSQVAVYLLGTGGGAIVYDDASLLDSTNKELLTNGTFEVGTTRPSSWNYYQGGTYSWVTSPVHGGTYALSIDSGASTSMVWQGVQAAPGQAFDAKVYTASNLGDTYTDMREVLRSLPDLYDDISLISTNAAPGHDGCHYLTAGYQELGNRTSRLLMRDVFQGNDTNQVEAPNIERISWTSATTLELMASDPTTQFSVEPGANYNFYLDGARVIGITPTGSHLQLTLDRPTEATTLSYLTPAGDIADVVNGRGVGLLSFYQIPIE